MLTDMVGWLGWVELVGWLPFSSRLGCSYLLEYVRSSGDTR